MKRKNWALLIPILTSLTLILSACNFPGLSKITQNPSQIETLAAATIQAQVDQYLTQTANAPKVVVITATPQATTSGAVIPLTPTVKVAQPTATSTPVPIPCNQAAFITDVTIPDGSSFIAGASFVKTWRVRNSGSCTWGSGYSIVFQSGNSMSAPAVVNLPKSVAPGGSVDISVPMIAPANTGNFTGNWLLRAPNGTLFGVGPNGGVPVTVVIQVNSLPAPKDPNTVYDFVKNYCQAQWRTNASFLNCPSANVNYTTGSITRTYAPLLENGVQDDEGTLITVPAVGGDGMIQGQYPSYLVHSGDHFVATILCSYQKPQCNVTFEVLAQVKGSSTITSLGKWAKTYNNTTKSIDVDLSSMDGQNIIFYLKVYSNGDPTDDMAQWMAPHITHP